MYSEPPHVGRGGWTWYTGSAAWMYRAGLEWMLGCRIRGATLLLDPCIPRNWPGFQVTLRYRRSRYEIAVENPRGVSRGLVSLQLDGAALPAQQGRVPLVDDGMHAPGARRPWLIDTPPRMAKAGDTPLRRLRA